MTSAAYALLSVLAFLALAGAFVQALLGLRYNNLKASDVALVAMNLLVFGLITWEWLMC